MKAAQIRQWAAHTESLVTAQTNVPAIEAVLRVATFEALCEIAAQLDELKEAMKK